jgi:hypothetical protein
MDKLTQLLFEGYAVVPIADQWFRPMCADQIKGNVTFNYTWGDGPSGGFTMHSDAAERKIIESAQAVIFHAMADGHAKLTLEAKRSNEAGSEDIILQSQPLKSSDPSL